MPFTIEITVDATKLRRQMHQLKMLPKKFTEQAIRHLGDFTLRTYRAQAPISEPRPGRETVGTLKASFVLETTPISFKVYPTAPHALYPLYGTAFHAIYPHGRMLRFFWTKVGRWVFMPFVAHPGQRRNPYRARTLRLLYLEIKRFIRTFLTRYMGKVNQ